MAAISYLFIYPIFDLYITLLTDKIENHRNKKIYDGRKTTIVSHEYLNSIIGNHNLEISKAKEQNNSLTGELMKTQNDLTTSRTAGNLRTSRVLVALMLNNSINSGNRTTLSEHLSNEDNLDQFIDKISSGNLLPQDLQHEGILDLFSSDLKSDFSKFISIIQSNANNPGGAGIIEVYNTAKSSFNLSYLLFGVFIEFLFLLKCIDFRDDISKYRYLSNNQKISISNLDMLDTLARLLKE
ncbi:hypothetical protein ACQE3E_21860 [Methylomonas sp. MED-D]|uniref:hypothetical protein n=1 Tax=Methylomonas sp. MED-D TaxID=3418768 RepID=UPI003CFC8A7E